MMKTFSVLLSAAALSSAISLPAPINVALDRLRGIGQQIPAVPEEIYLVELGPDERIWVTEEQKWKLRREGRTFFDITSSVSKEGGLAVRGMEEKAKRVVKYPEELAHNKS